MPCKKLLVIGGCGYIGSHMVKCLLDAGHEVVVLDDLSTGHRDALLGGKLVVGDCGDGVLLDQLFPAHRFAGVLHFASSIQVGESVLDPAKYYQNNVAKTLTLLTKMKEHNVGPLIFSSTAAVFGEPVRIPIDETHPRQPINPYGMSKYMVEAVLADFDRAYGLRSVALRYFNAAGADPEARIGERHDPETHLIPLALQAAMGRRQVLKVFGRDYPSPDGTCIRDYIHVDDLASAHLLALEYLWQGGASAAFNLGNGSGFSVQEVLDAVKRVTRFQVPSDDAPRRAGDPARLVADATRAKSILGWQPRYVDLDTIVRDAFNWEQRRDQNLSIGSEYRDPIISVVLPVYNGEKYLKEAIDSVLAQTFADFELIMLDDGSKDDSLLIMKEYELRDSRVRVITRENRGLPATLNDLIGHAKGKLIARMDADDICLPNRLSSQYEFMQHHPEVVALGSAAHFIEETGEMICTYIPPADDSVLREIFPGSPFIHPSVMLVKKAFVKSGKYPEKMKWGGEDVVLFGRIAKYGLLHNLSEPLICYRLVPGSMSRKPPEFRNLLTNIISDEISGEAVTHEHLQKLQDAARKIDKSKAEFDYHFEVAKLGVWSGASRNMITLHLNWCITKRVSLAKVIFMYFLAFMPHCWVKNVYFQLKGRRYGKC